jgi:predicted metal-dependent hydrolase
LTVSLSGAEFTIVRRSPVPSDLKVKIEGPNLAVLSWGETNLAVDLIASPRSRRVRATLNGTVVAVRYPARISKRRLADSIYALAGWIMAAKAESEQRSQTPRDVVLLDGIPLRLELLPGRSHVDVGSDSLIVKSTEGKAEEVLQRWLRRRAAETLPPIVAAQAARMDVVYTRVRIGDQSRRWGSCSSKGTISLNWRLTMAPPEVQQYLVIHELAHVREMNHSPKYWAVVAEFCPAYKTHERWLKDHGWRLMEMQ